MTQDQNTALQRQISAAILKLRMRAPFFATLALFARISITRGISTAATDGRAIFINQSFWEGLQENEHLGLIAHEVLHAALLHVYRCGIRDPLRWNIAADIVVNGIVIAQGFSLPEGHIRNQELEHLSVEEIYHLLDNLATAKLAESLPMQDLLDPKQGGLDPGLSGIDDRDRPASRLTGLSSDMRTASERYWQDALQQAQIIDKMTGKGQGTMPLGLQRELGHLNPAQIDWRAYLWRFLVQTPTDFAGFDQRFIGRRLYLDMLAGETVHIYVAVDTSGSIGQREIEQFLGEVQGILRAYPHLEAKLYYADAACYGPYTLTAQSEIPAPRGGGGTDFRPFFEAVEQEHDSIQPAVCVYLTDGYGTFPQQVPSLPVLWVILAGGLALQSIPFGEAVRLIPDPT
ncbi:hypothetical protein EPA93_26860 [Ktedonosporobacter rubrisoli]|uniref:Metallopeptidase domain-containing protein n=1 Tax=Ktedonosporobacter rubrisoli TaxID=2509675 RepID=A0A4V0YZE2_KTERU|nr:VWA-like domain-containing protein [Ktedonosporobacter rubrisoli]QBD79411.1 hypothetical protein EPA93_26860 [Ktedonosporobacter rubrisoli]